MTRETRRRLVALGIVAGAVVILVALIATRPEARRQAPQARPPLVTVHTVPDSQPPVVVTGWGTVQPRRSVNLVPQVSGRIVSVSPDLQAGGFFARGEVLLEIEDTDYRLAVRQAAAQVAQAEYNLATAREEARVARQEWERTRADAEAGSPLAAAQPTPLVFREPQLRQAEAALEAARAAHAQAELNLSRCRLTAPFDGRVISEDADPGDYVMAGSALGRIDDIGVAEITVDLPDHDLAWIDAPNRPGETRTGSPALVRADFAGTEHTWRGRVARLGGAIDETSRTVPVVVEVPAPYATDGERPPLLAGLYVAVDFPSPPPDGSVTIPRQALRPGDVTWLLTADGRLRLRPVEVIHAGREQVVIGAGVVPGDRLITSNLQYVVDGMPLRAENGATDRSAVAQDGGEAP
jgi:RND family efflux transporter MFP subunit